KAGKALGAVGNILTGQGQGTNTNPSELIGGLLGTKQPGTNATQSATDDKKANLIKGLGGILGTTSTATNAAGAKTNAPATNAVENVLDSLLRSRSKKK